MIANIAMDPIQDSESICIDARTIFDGSITHIGFHCYTFYVVTCMILKSVSPTISLEHL